VIFFLFGLYSMYEGGSAFPLSVWAAALGLTALTGWLFLHRKPASRSRNQCTGEDCDGTNP